MAVIYVPNTVVGIFKVALIFLFFAVITVVIALVMSRQLITNNWAAYRCNPLITPLATYFGHDPEKTTQECLNVQFKAASPNLFGPINNTLGSMASSMASAGSTVSGLNSLVGGVGTMFQSSFATIMGRLNNVGSATEYLVLKLQTLFQRLAATVLLIVYSMYTILQGLLAIKKDQALINAVQRLTGKSTLV